MNETRVARLETKAGRSAVQAVGAVLVVALLPGWLAAGEAELLPEVTGRFEGSYYAPAEDALVWDTWIGAGIGLLRVKAATGYMTADVETLLGRERRVFDANQVNYHLEGGIRIRSGRHLFVPFFHHVSRHLVDRPKDQLVDWNIVGLRVAGLLPGPFPLSARYAVSVGHTVEWRTVGYEWEVRGALDLDLVRRPWGTPYLRAGIRFVTVSTEARVARGSFADVLGEGGVRFERGGRNLDLFVAYEHRNDVFLFEPGAKDRALLGLRIDLAPEGEAGPDRSRDWPGPPSP